MTWQPIGGLLAASLLPFALREGGCRSFFSDPARSSNSTRVKTSVDAMHLSRVNTKANRRRSRHHLRPHWRRQHTHREEVGSLHLEGISRPFPSEACSRVPAPSAAAVSSVRTVNFCERTNRHQSGHYQQQRNNIRRPATDQADSRDVRVDDSTFCVCALTLSFPIIYTLSFI